MKNLDYLTEIIVLVDFFNFFQLFHWWRCLVMFPLLWSVLMTNTGTPFSPAIQVHCADGKHSSNCFSRWRWCSPSPSATNFPLLLAQRFYFIRFHFYYRYSQLKIIQVTGCFIMDKTKPQAKQSIELQLLLACLHCTCEMYLKLKNYSKLSNLRY